MSPVARDARALALSHGASEDAVDALRSKDVLLGILKQTNIDKDIWEDVLDACDLGNLSALALASGLLDVKTAEQDLFLTADEADVRILHSDVFPMPYVIETACQRSYQCRFGMLTSSLRAFPVLN